MTYWFERYMNDILTEITLERATMITVTTFGDGRIETQRGDVSDTSRVRDWLVANGFVEVG
jgi:hypothetical protein